MTVTVRKISLVPPATRNAAPEQTIPAARIEAAERQAEAASGAAFSDNMEMAMTGLVVIGALLFAAALVRYGAPAGAWRDCASAVLYALATLGGVFLSLFTLKAIFLRVAYFARRRG